MTLEEYMASKAMPDSDNFKSIKVREVDDEFAGKMAKVAVEEDFLVMGGGKNLRKKAGKAGKEKQSIDVGFRVAKPSSGGGDRDRRERGRRDGGRSGGNDRRGRDGGRGGGRGGGDRKGGRSAKINTTDTAAFPSL
jgi:plasminogen activator inhibitor 1 RNA-binding protein